MHVFIEDISLPDFFHHSDYSVISLTESINTGEMVSEHACGGLILILLIDMGRLISSVSRTILWVCGSELYKMEKVPDQRMSLFIGL